MTDETHPEELPLDAAQTEAAAAYHAPPGIIPREVMWDVIRARRSGSAGASLSGEVASATSTPVEVLHTSRGALQRSAPRWIAAAGVAAAAVFAVSVYRAPSLPETRVAAAADTLATSAAWQAASSEHFGLAESMLTMLSNSPSQQGDAQLSAWSRDLLESTRLMMDSPAGRDPKRRALLQDLELVLVQLVASGPAMRNEDRTMMDHLLSQSARLLTRIRTTVPAGTSATINQ